MVEGPADEDRGSEAVVVGQESVHRSAEPGREVELVVPVEALGLRGLHGGAGEDRPEDEEESKDAHGAPGPLTR
jgi:hypothetical protein